ncbi:MAG: hypothetical protein KAT56_04800 [Sedimentisphaerales bacterium]|nr:hypothetical protein [Sedimentisphaerales bacterium]
MNWQSNQQSPDGLGNTTTIEPEAHKQLNHSACASAEYIQTACTIYESLITNYLAIADELARREGVQLLFPLKTGISS